MHRHGYKGRKFGRKTDQRKALTRGLMCALIEYQSINTTLARAKEIRRSAEKLITLARKGGLANRRLLIARLGNLEAATILIDLIAPQIKRDSGYLRIERAGFRRGDNAEMATISFVDDIVLEPEAVAQAKEAAEKEADAEVVEKAKATNNADESEAVEVEESDEADEAEAEDDADVDEAEATAEADGKEEK